MMGALAKRQGEGKAKMLIHLKQIPFRSSEIPAPVTDNFLVIFCWGFPNVHMLFRRADGPGEEEDRTLTATLVQM
jgi:hypothetical protein